MVFIDTRARQRTSVPRWIDRIPAAYWIVGLALLFMPIVANDFVLFQIFGWTFILGMIALSLMFLTGYWGHGEPGPDVGRRNGRLYGRDLR